MQKRISRRCLWHLALLGILLAGPGCQDYTIDVVLEPDGGGHRSVSLEVDSRLDGDGTPTLEDYGAYFGLDPALGWKRESAPDEAGGASSSRPHTRFSRDLRLPDVAAWASAGGDLRVRASLSEGPNGRIEFRNAIEVVSGTENGAPWLAYSETFHWQELASGLVRLQSDRFDALIAEAFPELGTEPRAELRGILGGAFLADVRLQVDDADDAERESMQDIYAELMRDVLQRNGFEIGASSASELLQRTLEDPEGEAEALMLRILPGLDQAFLTSIELRVRFPGVIVDSNADEVEGNAARWRFEISDAIFEPLELYARAGPAVVAVAMASPHRTT